MILEDYTGAVNEIASWWRIAFIDLGVMNKRGRGMVNDEA